MKKILAIEDDTTLIKILQTRLTVERGFIFLTSIDPDEGIRKIEEERPDLVILDILLPKRSGVEILEEIRHNPKIKDVPVLILSMVGREDVVRKFEKLGISGYIVKGFTSFKETIDNIESILSRDSK